LTSEKGTQEIKGLAAGALPDICAEMKNQTLAKDAGGRPEWEKMCVYSEDGKTLLRIISPNIFASIDRVNNLMSDYYQSYVDDMWVKYTKEPLLINTQGNSAGQPMATSGQGVQGKCKVGTDSIMLCDNAPGYKYPKPTTADIWGCNSGPFVVGAATVGDVNSMMHSRNVPRICAAFERTTLHYPDGNVQPYVDAGKYYQHPVTNHYSRIVHRYLDAGKGYAFAYDDVNPEGIEHNAAGVLDAQMPTKLHLDVKGDK
jgi:hypothetical protein